MKALCVHVTIKISLLVKGQCLVFCVCQIETGSLNLILGCPMILLALMNMTYIEIQL